MSTAFSTDAESGGSDAHAERMDPSNGDLGRWGGSVLTSDSPLRPQARGPSEEALSPKF